MWDMWVDFVQSTASIVGPGPAVLLVSLGAGAVTFALGALAITFNRFGR